VLPYRSLLCGALLFALAGSALAGPGDEAYARAVAAAAGDDLIAAHRELVAALAAEPGHVAAHLLLARIYTAAGATVDAALEFAWVIATAPGTAAATDAAAGLRTPETISAELWEEAQQALQRVTVATPDAAAALAAAKVLTAAGAWFSADRALSYAQAAGTDVAGPALELAAAVAAGGRTEDAVNIYRRTARALHAAHQDDAAAAAYESLIGLRPEPSDWVELAQVHLDRGDTQAAEQVLRRALDRDPQNADAHLALGELRLQQGDAAAAEPHLQAARESGDPRVLCLTANAYWQRGLDAEAGACWQRALDALGAGTPPPPDATALQVACWNGLALARSAAGDDTGAAEYLQRICALDATGADPAYTRFRARLAMRRWQGAADPAQLAAAIAAWRDTVRQGDADATDRNQLALCLLDQYDRLHDRTPLDEAIGLLTEVAKGAPQDASPHLSLGGAWMRSAAYDARLIASLEENLHAAGLPGYYAFCRELRERGRDAQAAAALDAAVAAYREALRLAPGRPEAITSLLCLLEGLGRDADLQAVTQAAQASPRWAAICESWATAHEQAAQHDAALGRADDALAEARRAVAVAPESAAAQGVLGVMLLRQGLTAEAITALERASNLGPAESWIWSQLGLAYLDARRVDDAERVGRHLLDEVDPNSATGHFLVGLVALERNQPEPARAALEEALRLKPDWASAHANLATACSLLKDYDAAWQHALRAQELGENVDDILAVLQQAAPRPQQQSSPVASPPNPGRRRAVATAG